MKKTLLISLVLCFYSTFSQNLIDTIITKNAKTIPCQITYVNNYSVFYKIQKRNKLKDQIIPRIDIVKLVINTENVTVLEEKYDSGINDYFRKSKLSKEYETLLLTDNSDPSLTVLADSTFKCKTSDFFYIATMIQSFANQYKCKLVHLNETKSTQTYHVRLYDASDEYYHKVLELYKQNQVHFIRTSNNMDYKEVKFKINDEKITLHKNEYYTYIMTEEDTSIIIKRGGISAHKQVDYKDGLTNQYFYIGKPNYYSDLTARNLGITIGAIAGGLVGGFIVAGISYEKTQINNFIGEFIKLHIDRKE